MWGIDKSDGVLINARLPLWLGFGYMRTAHSLWVLRSSIYRGIEELLLTRCPSLVFGPLVLKLVPTRQQNAPQPASRCPNLGVLWPKIVNTQIVCYVKRVGPGGRRV